MKYNKVSGAYLDFWTAGTGYDSPLRPGTGYAFILTIRVPETKERVWDADLYDDYDFI